jgi:tetratricopeptide (TPR) repeat protein
MPERDIWTQPTSLAAGGDSKPTPPRIDPIGDILLSHNIITIEQLRQALEVQRQSKGRLGRVLVEMGIVSERQLAWGVAQQWGLPYTELAEDSVNPDAARLIPAYLAQRLGVIAVDRKQGRLVVAMPDPSNVVAIDDIRLLTGLDVEIIIASPDDIARLQGKFPGLVADVEELHKNQPAAESDILAAPSRTQEVTFERVFHDFAPASGEGCPELLVLHHFATGKLSVDESRSLMAHLNTCLYCQREITELRKMLYFEEQRIPYWIDKAGLAVRLPRLASLWNALGARLTRPALWHWPSVGLPRARQWAVAVAVLVVVLAAGRLLVAPALAQSPPVLAAAKQVAVIRWLLPASTQEYLQAMLVQDQLGEVKSSDQAQYDAVARQAEAHLNQAITLNPRYVDANQALGSLYENWYFWNPTARDATKHLTLAETAYMKAVQLRPNYLDAHRGLGDIYAVTGEFAKEEREYDTILAADPDDSDTRSSRGWVRLERGDYQDAIADFRASLRRDPKDFDTLTALAMAYAASGDAASVERTYRQLDRVNPGRARLLRKLVRPHPTSR